MSKLVKLEDLRKLDRKFIEETINNDISENAYECEEYDNTIIEGIYEVSFEYKTIIIYDEDGDPEDREEKLTINSIYEHNIEELLKAKGLEYELSKGSESVYLNNGDTRISTHKRPAYDTGNGNYEEHEYKQDIILENEIEMYKYIEREF